MNFRNSVTAIAIAVALFCVVRLAVLEYRVAALEQNAPAAQRDYPVIRLAWWLITNA